MTLHQRYGLTRVINARGPFTPLGVSRSSAAVGQAVAQALGEYFVLDELQDAFSRAVSRLTGAEAGAVSHCVAAGVTVSIAAAMTGMSPALVAALPDTAGMANRVVLPAPHDINYGHPITQAIRLAGAVPVLAGTGEACSMDDLDTALGHPQTCCLLLVSSRLVHGEPADLASAVARAHSRGIPVIIDAAGQDLRIEELLATGADLVLVSAQKYMASPTAGLVVGRSDLVNAVRAQDKGIGRGMKATKEAIVGVLAAIEEREQLDLAQWSATQHRKVLQLVDAANLLDGVTAQAITDPTDLPFSRAHVHVDGEAARLDAGTLCAVLQSGTPSIRVMEHELANAELVFELVQVDDRELQVVLARLQELLT